MPINIPTIKPNGANPSCMNKTANKIAQTNTIFITNKIKVIVNN